MHWVEILAWLAGAFKVIWPAFAGIIPAVLAWRQFESARKKDQIENAKVAAQAKTEREQEAARLDALREGRDGVFRTQLIQMSEDIAKRTIEEQQKRVEALGADNAKLRTENDALFSRIRELESENVMLKANLLQVEGDVRNLHQVIESMRRVGVEPSLAQPTKG